MEERSCEVVTPGWKSLILGWAGVSLGAVLLLVPGNGVRNPRSIVFFFVLLVSTLALVAALRRHGDLSVLAGFVATRTGRLSVANVLVLAAAAAATVTPALGALLFVGLNGLFFFLWWRSGSVSSLRELVQKAVLLLVATSITLAFCEAVLRIPAIADRTIPPAHRVAMNRWSQDRYDDRTFILWKDQTLRSFHLNEEWTDDVATILVLGDSFTWGDKIRQTEETWPYVMERAMGEAGEPARVISLARRGNTTVNEVEYLQTYGWDFYPDVVVVQYFLNDPLPSSPGFGHQGQRWMKARVFPMGFSRRLDRLFETSYLYSFLVDKWSNMVRTALGLKNLTLEDLHEDGFESWEETKRAVGKLADECRERDVPILFAMFPSFPNGGWLDHRYPYLRIHEKVRAVVEEKNIPFFDLRPVFAETDSEAKSWWALPTDAHPSAAGHDLAGRAIADEIKRMRLMPGGGRQDSVGYFKQQDSEGLLDRPE